MNTWQSGSEINALAMRTSRTNSKKNLVQAASRGVRGSVHPGCQSGDALAKQREEKSAQRKRKNKMLSLSPQLKRGGLVAVLLEKHGRLTAPAV